MLVALGLLAFYGPGIYQKILFRRSISQFLAEARSGNTAGWSSYISASQQRPIALQLQRLPKDYQQDIASLKLTSYDQTAPDTIWAIVTLHLTESSGGAIYQGKLRWRWQQKRWVWDFTASYAAPYVPTTEPDWVKLTDMLALAEAL